MSGFTTANDSHLIRSQLWSKQIKEVLEDELFAMRYVRMIQDFPDGDLINIPSIGQAEVVPFVENSPVQYTALDTGNFQFSIDQYDSSATHMSRKMMQDSFYAAELAARFVPAQSRAIMKKMETKVLAVGPEAQTSGNLNAINGANHRFVANGTNETMAVKDFALANYALDLANVPVVGRVAIVDPSVEYTLSTLSNLVTLDSNPRWEGIVRDRMSTGMRFSMNVYGFDVYVSQNLKKSVNETIDSKTTTSGVANLFFSTAGDDVMPFIGQLRQAPTVDSEFNKDLQREEYVTTARYGFKLYRPENLVTVITDTDQVS